MTQKEYREKVSVLEEKIKELRESEKILIEKQFNYNQVLEDYHRVSEELKMANRAIDMHLQTEQGLRETINRYEKMLDRVTFNC